MELGHAKLRRNGLNSLKNAIHPKHGLAWTDGNNVYLAPVNLVDDEVENNTSLKLGDFDNVQALHWSNDIPGNVCYLCVVRTATVSLWKVEGAAPDLSFKQVRRINASPIPQGCLWNPRRDIICILSKDQCSFYFRHSQNKGSYALPPIESGKVTCGCWSPDGKKLIVGIGSIVLIYQWIDIDKSISEYTITAWKIPNVDGKVVAMVSISNNHVICTADLPLEKLCKIDDNMFDVNDLLSGDGDSSSLENENADIEVIKPRKGALANKDTLLNLPRAEGLKIDSSQLILFEIQSNMMEPCKLGSSTIKGILSPDLLYCRSEDLVIVGSNTQNIVQVYTIANQDIHKVHEIRLMGEERPKGIWGVPPHMYTHGEGMLVMLGKCTQTDNTFLPPSMESSYSIKLQFVAIAQGVRHQNGSSNVRRPGTPHLPSPNGHGSHLPDPESHLAEGNRAVHLLRFNTLDADAQESRYSGSIHSDQSDSSPRGISLSGPASPQINLNLPGVLAHDPIMNRNQIQCLSPDQAGELEVERANFDGSAPQFRNDFGFERMSLREEEGVPLPDPEEETLADARSGDAGLAKRNNNLSSPLLYSASTGVSASEPLRMLKPKALSSIHISTKNEHHDASDQSASQAQFKSQRDQIQSLNKHVEDLAKSVQRLHTKQNTYYSLASMEWITIVFITPDGSNRAEKTFILDNGRLQIAAVKDSFGLQTVEILHEGTNYCVGGNSDGYMPIKFQHRQKVCITGLMTPNSDAQTFC